jgi:hypothetical protein
MTFNTKNNKFSLRKKHEKQTKISKLLCVFFSVFLEKMKNNMFSLRKKHEKQTKISKLLCIFRKDEE